jgi:tetratricopeptide (TPR) repeat protein
MKPLKTLNTGVTDREENKETSNSSNTDTTSPLTHTSITKSWEFDARTIQNFLFVWLDSNIDKVNNVDSISTITKIRQIVNSVRTFTDVDECIDFMTDIEDEKIFMICSGELGQTTVPLVCDIPQINCVYVFCKHRTRHEKWTKKWSKVKGVHTDITSICEALKQAARDCDHNSVSISFVKPADGTSNINLDTLDKSFMYTQILKEILLTIDFEQPHINEFLTYCREQFTSNSAELKNVDKMEKEYRDHQPIWWYTCSCFLYSMLNRALRLMEVDLIIKIGFFIRDLHNHIAALHSEQYCAHQDLDSFIVYRGQGLSQTDFEQLKQTQGGLLAFNNFLSTSVDRAVSLAFADSNQYDPDLIGVLFVITVNTSTVTSPFAKIGNVSFYQGEEEILFSMHSVFRIAQVKQIDSNDRLWQVDLTLTGDNDPQLHALTTSVRAETYPGNKGWYRLGQLMIKLGQFNKAEELCEMLFKQTTNEYDKGYLFYQVGWIKSGQGKYSEAIRFYEKVLEICQKTFPANYLEVEAACYISIGFAYKNMRENSKALSYYEKVLEILQKGLPTNHPNLATTYNHIGLVYNNTGEYSKALSYYEKAFEIVQKILPANHPHLAASYNNIGSAYHCMDEYSKALSYYEKVLEIVQKVLPANHPDLAASYNNIGGVYDSMGEYSKALSYYEKALEIWQNVLPANHPNLAASYNNIGVVYRNMEEYSKALSYYEKVLEIEQKTLPENHPDLAIYYNNISLVYEDMGEYSKAISYYSKALEIRQKTLPANHPDLATSYNNI